ncbi:MAG: extracellular solute-binding protein [Angelakisella sp.]
MKKLFALVLAAAMCLSAAACGASAPASPAPAPAAPASPAAPAPAPVPEPAKAVEINVVTTFAGTDGNGPNYQAGIKEWEAKSGNKVNDASATSEEAFKARIMSDFETGAEPDVLFYFNGVDSNPFVEAGKVVSIEEIRKEYPEYGKNMKDGMLGASPIDGKNYSLPVNGYWEGLYVNKTVLADCSVKVPDASYTWDQFLKDCETIKAKGYAPIAASLAEVPHYWFEFSIYNHLTPATHNILPKTADDEHGKAWISGMKDIKDLFEKGYFPANTLSAKDEDTVKMFVEGKAAFLIDGSWKVGNIEGNFVAKEGEAPDPEKIKNFTVTYVPGKNNRKATDIIGGLSSGYFITKKAWDDPAKRAAAVDFVTHMTSDAMVSKFAAVSATALVNGVTVDESKLSSLAKDGLALVKGATGMASAVQDQIKPDCRVPLFDGMPKIVSGKVTPEAAVAECLKLIAENA